MTELQTINHKNLSFSWSFFTEMLKRVFLTKTEKKDERQRDPITSTTVGENLQWHVTVCECSLWRTTLSFQRGDPVSDIVLHTLPCTRLQCIGLSRKTLFAVLFLRNLVSLNETHHVSFHSTNFFLPPFMFVLILGACESEKRNKWLFVFFNTKNTDSKEGYQLCIMKFRHVCKEDGDVSMGKCNISELLSQFALWFPRWNSCYILYYYFYSYYKYIFHFCST